MSENQTCPQKLTYKDQNDRLREKVLKIIEKKEKINVEKKGGQTSKPKNKAKR